MTLTPYSDCRWDWPADWPPTGQLASPSPVIHSCLLITFTPLLSRAASGILEINARHARPGFQTIGNPVRRPTLAFRSCLLATFKSLLSRTARLSVPFPIRGSCNKHSAMTPIWFLTPFPSTLRLRQKSMRPDPFASVKASRALISASPDIVRTKRGQENATIARIREPAF